ncbi:MAG TPA: 3-hydroxyacyl-ACP dehydratase FabZ [Candidatus Polarisedimenticolia bacterium]|nr:3-hydroxyacyl-ACP dehydratase FabZ [Candidatus Polarisedimenticolia bacterium]
MLDIREIMAIIPHRYPFLLVDRIVELEKDTRAVGIKNVSVNEPFFQGHFPGIPIMPGVLIVEGMAQVGAAMLLSSIPDRSSRLIYFTGIDKCRFRRPVVPGDQVRYELKVLRLKAQVCRMWGEAHVDGQLAAEAEILSAMTSRPQGGP